MGSHPRGAYNSRALIIETSRTIRSAFQFNQSSQNCPLDPGFRSRLASSYPECRSFHQFRIHRAFSIFVAGLRFHDSISTRGRSAIRRSSRRAINRSPSSFSALADDDETIETRARYRHTVCSSSTQHRDHTESYRGPNVAGN